eukprot:CAMPEP_0115012272 /NCGR_PEP_ID=MMETSP0216-20121206/24617_1 /TAXON_ID=223996 /ORGANISM="Protocruzia adherens, Strain Boccale" /LENGTH=353 /DNA_ID=CAMNT_0002381255 /DNA_START=77 /DNA_END=1138 /DNA_ORIENTATION=+
MSLAYHNEHLAWQQRIKHEMTNAFKGNPFSTDGDAALPHLRTNSGFFGGDRKQGNFLVNSRSVADVRRQNRGSRSVHSRSGVGSRQGQSSKKLRTLVVTDKSGKPLDDSRSLLSGGSSQHYQRHPSQKKKLDKLDISVNLEEYGEMGRKSKRPNRWLQKDAKQEYTDARKSQKYVKGISSKRSSRSAASSVASSRHRTPVKITKQEKDSLQKALTKINKAAQQRGDRKSNELLDELMSSLSQTFMEKPGDDVRELEGDNDSHYQSYHEGDQRSHNGDIDGRSEYSSSVYSWVDGESVSGLSRGISEREREKIDELERKLEEERRYRQEMEKKLEMLIQSNTGSKMTSQRAKQR